MNPGVLFDFQARVLSLHGQVEEGNFNAFVDQLLRLDTDANCPITIYFSSCGGNLVDMLKVLDIFATLRSPTTAIAMGVNEGAAAILLTATGTRLMLPSSLLCTARLWDLPGPPVGLQASTTETLRSHLHERLQILKARWPQAIRLVLEAERQPRFIAAREALALGLIDRIIQKDPISLPAHHPHVR